MSLFAGVFSTFEQFLLKEEVIDEIIMREVLVKCQAKSSDFGDELLASGMVDDFDDARLSSLRAEHLGLAASGEANKYTIDRAKVAQITSDICVELSFVPVLEIESKREFLLVSNPHDSDAMAVIETTQLISDIERLICPKGQIGEILAQIKVRVNSATEVNLKQKAEEMVKYAIENEVSDIHILPQSTQTMIRMRKDGVLRAHMSIPSSEHDQLVNVFMSMSGADPSKKLLVSLGGEFNYTHQGSTVDVRFESSPSIYGATVVMRFFAPSSKPIPKLSVLGHSGKNVKILESIRRMPYGMIFVTGPTGSGKSTTMHAVLKTMDSASKKIMTAEDPVERKLDGIIQIKVGESTSMTFGDALKSFLRQDPDVILIGETRDAETAEKAVEAALTGHLLITTVHANNACETPQRVIALGVKPYMFVDALKIIVAQKLVKKSCPNCKKEVSLEDQLKKSGVEDENIARIYRERVSEKVFFSIGCDRCERSGYKGRQVVSEILVANDKIKNAILEEKPAHELQKIAEESGFVSIKEHALRLLNDGIISLPEFLDSVQGFDYNDVVNDANV